MLRRIVGCLMLFALVLQGVAQASADLSAGSGTPQHCDGHDMAADDCACCPDGGRSANDCAKLCSLSAALTATLPRFVFDPPAEFQLARITGLAGPAYLPLKPPPKPWL